MNAPRRPDGPPVRDGKPYSAIAHLAEDVKPFVAMANGLRDLGFSAPEIYHTDHRAGLSGAGRFRNSKTVVAGEPPAPIEACYREAVNLLLALHQHDLPEILPVTDEIEHRIPHYDMDALLIEVELLLDWYIPRFRRSGAGTDAGELCRVMA